jgi:plastocyanin
MRRAGLACLVAVAAAALAPAGARAATVPVNLEFQAFAPQAVDVLPGDTVEWSNGSVRRHTVTANDGSFDSGDLFEGGTFSRQFDAAGAYPYHCTVHLGMNGEVDVRPVILDPLPPTPVPLGRPVAFTGRTADPAAPVTVQVQTPTGFASVATAIAAPDGTSILFCHTDPRGGGWLGDFIRADDAPDRLGLTGVDHVALSQPFDYFDEAALFYRSVLDLAPRTSEELAGPDGLIRSRVVADRAGTVRFALNVPLLAHNGDGELQHVAFACDDVLAAARELRDRGLPLLRISGNYYDDLAARLDLDPGLVEEMRDLGVLYDRDEHGELLHVYTPLLGHRLFFEVLERRGGYDGYGAANSPVRMAAQRALASEYFIASSVTTEP